jgi:hypothetical protein
MKRFTRVLLLIFLLVFVIVYIGCQSENPFSPSNAEKITRSTDQIRFLKSSFLTSNKVFSEKKLITAAEGGYIRVGNEKTGYSSIYFEPGDLNKDAMIKFEWDPHEYIAELEPHGLAFNNPVELQLSYANIDILDLNEENLKIWYFNEDTRFWELVESEANILEKHVEGYITHFSEYGLGEDD